MLYLSQAIGRPVLDAAGEPIGKVDDLIVALGPATRPSPASSSRPTGGGSSCPGRTSPGSMHRARACRRATIDITKFHQREDEFLLREDLLDKQIVDIDGRKVVRVNDLRLDDVEGKLHLVAVDVGASGLLRRLGHGRRLPDPRAEPEPAGPRALHRLGGRRPGRDERRLDQAPRPACRPDRAASGRPGHDHRPAGAARPGRRPGRPRRRGRRRRDRGDGARHAGRGPRRPGAGARRRHPRGDVARRRRRPRRRPVRRDPPGAAGPDGARRGRGARRPARLPRGHGRRHDDDRVRRGRGAPDRRPDDRAAARARARRRDDLLRLRRRRRGPAGRRAVAARPDRRPAVDADRRGDDRRAGLGRRPGRSGRGRRRSSPATTCWRSRSSTPGGGWSGIVTVDDAIDTILPASWRRRVRPAASRS